MSQYILNEWRRCLAAKSLRCVGCKMPIRKCSHFQENVWQTPTMPAPAFYPFHGKCASTFRMREREIVRHQPWLA